MSAASAEAVESLGAAPRRLRYWGGRARRQGQGYGGDDLTGRTILRFIKNSVDPGPESPSLGSVLISDEYPPYRVIGRFMPHQAINHQERYSDRSGGHTTPLRASGV